MSLHALRSPLTNLHYSALPSGVNAVDRVGLEPLAALRALPARTAMPGILSACKVVVLQTKGMPGSRFVDGSLKNVISSALLPYDSTPCYRMGKD